MLLPAPRQQPLRQTPPPLGPEFVNVGAYAQLCPLARGRPRGHRAPPSPTWLHPKRFRIPRDSTWRLLCAGRDRAGRRVGRGDGCHFGGLNPLKSIRRRQWRSGRGGALPSRRRCGAAAPSCATRRGARGEQQGKPAGTRGSHPRQNPGERWVLTVSQLRF